MYRACSGAQSDGLQGLCNGGSSLAAGQGLGYCKDRSVSKGAETANHRQARRHPSISARSSSAVAHQRLILSFQASKAVHGT